MAELACEHHDMLQDEDIDPNMSPKEYTEKLENILRVIPETQHL